MGGHLQANQAGEPSESRTGDEKQTNSQNTGKKPFIKVGTDWFPAKEQWSVGELDSTGWSGWRSAMLSMQSRWTKTDTDQDGQGNARSWFIKLYNVQLCFWLEKRC